MLPRCMLFVIQFAEPRATTFIFEGSGLLERFCEPGPLFEVAELGGYRNVDLGAAHFFSKVACRSPFRYSAKKMAPFLEK